MMKWQDTSCAIVLHFQHMVYTFETYTLEGEDLININLMAILKFSKTTGGFRVNPPRLDYLGIAQ